MFRSARRKGGASGAPAAGPDVAGILRASGLVDADYYRESNPDVAAAGVDPVDHYAANGAQEARNPNPFFDSAWYLAVNGDVREAGLNPLLHYVAGGAAEGRSAGPDFDTAYYLARNPEVDASGMNPLLHYIRYGRAEGRDAVPLDEGEAFEIAARARRQGVTGPAATLFSGPLADRVHLPLMGRGEPSSPGAFPLPPLRLARRGGSATLDDFDASGRDIHRTVLRTLPKGWDWSDRRCLDFGSGVGRVLRHFGAEASRAEFWGCDGDGSSVRWSVENLSPPFRFVQLGEATTLPFEDGSFDLVIAVSVLSRMPTAWHQALVEIRRILKPGGVLFATFLGPTPMAEMLGEPYEGRGGDFGMIIEGAFRSGHDGGGPAVFVSPGWLKAFWGSIFDIDYIALDGLMEDQSLVVARKPAPGAPMRTEVPVLRPSTAQRFDPDAVGRIHPQVDLARPYRQSYGLDLAARSGAVVSGWMAFRDDVAERVEVLVDGRPVAAEATVIPGADYRDWASPVADFSAVLDLSAVARGAHKLEARLRSRGGRSHGLSIPLLIR